MTKEKLCKTIQVRQDEQAFAELGIETNASKKSNQVLRQIIAALQEGERVTPTEEQIKNSKIIQQQWEKLKEKLGKNDE